MKLDPRMTPGEIESHLRAQAKQIYGEERADVASDQIEHLSRMMAELARRELELTDEPPDLSGIQDRDER